MLHSLVINPFFGYFFIFLARITDVSMDVFRLLMLTRGYAVPAALIGFFELCVYVVALGSVLSGGLTDPWKIFAYAAGFATGNFVGSFIEKRLAIGYVVIQMFPPSESCEELTALLRKNNYGVTKMIGEGRSGLREILIVNAKRRDQKHILDLMNEVAPDTFYNLSDIRSKHGGVFPHA